MRIAILAFLLLARTASGVTFLSEIQTGITWALAPAVTPDGQFAYSESTVFFRDTGSGLLTAVGSGPNATSPDDLVFGSADAAFVYTTGLTGVSVHARDNLSGQLTLVEIEPGSPIFPFRDPRLLAVSLDGTNLYGTTISSVLTYTRNTSTGELTFLQEIPEGLDPGEIPNLGGARGVVVSPDNLHVYVAGDALFAFERTPPDGALTHLATYSVPSSQFESLVMSPDGLDVYAGTDDPGIARYTRDPLTGLLTFASLEPATVREGLERFTDNVEHLAMSADGMRLVGTVQTFVVVFDRDPLTGALDLLTVERTSGGRDATISPNGNNVYAGAKPGSVYLFVDFSCTPAPALGCQGPVASRRSAISIRNSIPTSDKLTWRTTPAGVTSLADFGDPVTGSDDVVVCLYDASVNPQPVAEIVGPARGTCDREPCWELSSSGTTLKYTDPTGLPGGLQKLTARERDPDNGVVKVKARSRGLALPALPLTPPVRVQLQSRTGSCWEAVFSVPKNNDAARFNAKSD